jgi:hypothetical protein
LEFALEQREIETEAVVGHENDRQTSSSTFEPLVPRLEGFTYSRCPSEGFVRLAVDLARTCVDGFFRVGDERKLPGSKYAAPDFQYPGRWA